MSPGALWPSCHRVTQTSRRRWHEAATTERMFRFDFKQAVALTVGDYSLARGVLARIGCCRRKMSPCECFMRRVTLRVVWRQT